MKIVLTMTINMIMPIISCAISFILPQVKVWYDSKGTFSPYITRSKSMGKYKYFRGGSAYMISFKYSDALNVCFVVMMYGISMPILFPIGAITLALQRLSERT